MRSKFVRLGFLVATIVGAVGLIGVVQAATVEPLKISGTLGEEVGGNIFDLFKISPNGQRVVYTVFNIAESKTELYSVLVTGGSAVKLSRNIDTSVFQYQISPDSTIVVYKSGTRLHRVPIAGGAAVRVDSDTEPHDGVTYKISAIDNRVVYTAFTSLYSAPTTGGGTIVELSTFVFASMDLTTFQLSSDGSKVLFIPFEIAVSKSHIFVAPVGGGGLVELGTSLTNLDPFITRFASGGNRVVFAAYFLEMGITETGLFSESLTGGIVRLDDEQVFNSSAFLPFVITPDGSSVLYVFPEFTTGVDILKIVPAAGGATVRLDSNMDGKTKNCGFKTSQNGAHVAYCAKDPSSSDQFLYSVAAAGGPAAIHNASNPSDGLSLKFAFSPDSARLAFVINNPAGATFAHSIYGSPVLANSATKLQNVNLGCFDNETFQFTGDSSKLVYCSFVPGSTNIGVAATVIDGGATEELTGTSPPAANVLFFEVVSNQTHAVFLTQSLSTNDINIYSIEIPDFLPDELCFPIGKKNSNLAVICL